MRPGALHAPDTRQARSVLTADHLKLGESPDQLRLQRAFFEEIFQHAPEAAVVLSLQGKVLRVNREFVRMFGFGAEEVLGSGVDPLIVPDTLRGESRALEEAVSEGLRVERETVRARVDGSLVDVAILAQPIQIEGIRVATYVSYREITQRKREEQARQKFVALVENGTDLIGMATLDGELEYVNTAGLTLLGLSLVDAVRNYRLEDLVAADEADRFRRIVLPTVLREGRWSGELHFRSASVDRIPMQCSFFLVCRPDTDDPVAIATISRDITDRKQAEAQLRRTRDMAEEANRAKSQFLANMSHEIRTPLNAIVGMADLLWETELAEDQEEYVRVFRSAGSTLLELINDILDLSKIEAGEIRLEDRPFRLDELVSGLVDVFGVQARQKGVGLAGGLDPGVPVWVRGDSTRLRQVLVNLLGNALKFTESGHVSLRVRPGGDGTRTVGTRALRFAVSDTGIGIPESKLEAVFGRFTQADASTTRKHGGTGLGLTISRSLVEMMGGRIWAESVVGEGTTFQFTVSLGSVEDGVETEAAGLSAAGRASGSEPSAAAQASPEADRPARVLVVEDTPDNQKLIQAYLKKSPHVLTLAENGQEGLDAYVANPEFDVVFMDMQMPVLDGYAATRAIRDWEAANGRDPVPIVALTAHALKEEAEKCLAAGCDAHLTKPIRKSGLLEAIQIHRRDAGAAGR